MTRIFGVRLFFFVDGSFYGKKQTSSGDMATCMYDCNGTLLNTFQFGAAVDVGFLTFDKGILCSVNYGNHHISYVLLSHGLEKIAEISLPQREIEHGLKEDMRQEYVAAANGTLYAAFAPGENYWTEDSWYRLNTDAYEWEDTGDSVPSESELYEVMRSGNSFLGKYMTSYDGIYDIITGEQVFEYGELYRAACYEDNKLCYFGGDKYLGYKDKGYRWVSLTDLSMSDPLPFPEGKNVTILDDTYCVYEDKYGWFLWNYNDGTEETIVMYDN